MHNTREAIFDAMQRRETYTTTGSRMGVRFFGGYDFTDQDAANLSRKTGPLQKDPISGNLDRIQIVKGWVDADGALQEKVYNVVWAGDRQMDENGKLPEVGNTVDVENATWINTIGASELITTWQDPDFDPNLSAFYYARVIEIPTPRWTAYEAKRFGIEMPDYVPMITTERAYTSPIWYTPG